MTGQVRYPYRIMEDGAQKECLYEWLNATQEAVAGVGSANASWLDNVKARLSDWNTAINGRFVIAETELKEGLKQYYGMTDADFVVVHRVVVDRHRVNIDADRVALVACTRPRRRGEGKAGACLCIRLLLVRFHGGDAGKSKPAVP